MKSPFPGMDPYLQQHWRDVHTSLVIYARDQLQPGLPLHLVARVDERVLTEPLIVKFQDEPITEPFIEIRDARSGNRVVTFIEFISPTNKIPGKGYDLYRQKQKDAEHAEVSLVEVDLVLGGKRVLSVPLNRLRLRDRTRYQAIVRRGWQWHKAEVYPLPLDKRLPAIHIALRQTDPDTRLNLQTLIELAYQNGGYDTIDYQVDSDPPLEGHDAEWADALLRQAGKRQ